MIMLEQLLLGRLSLDAIPYENPIIMSAGAFMGLLVVAVIGAIFYFRKWKWLWREWLTTVDHKKIGVMYLILAFLMLLRGFSDALLMRSQQALAYGSHMGYLPPEHYNQIFTAHGVIMIFFMAMSFLFGLVNLIVPIQIGARDVAYPYLNSLSFWLTAAGAGLVNISLVVGSFAATGWLAYPPLSELAYSPGVGVDYYLWALQISGVGTLLAGINIFATIIKMRCPGMTLMRMPVFVWTVLCAMVLVILAFPILNMTGGLLFCDRFFGSHFFTTAFGGNTMLYVNLIWAWGHPEVYILVLPAFGIFSEVVATFCKKTLFGYTSMVYATAAITFLSFVVWLHHFFTMGAGANVNAFFGITTMIIAVPTGVKVFNWLATMYKGRITFSIPMMWTLAFLVTFTVGGMTGVLMAIPPVDFQVHNSLFLIAHFHNTIIGGVVFGFFAGFNYWFPKIFGFRLNHRFGVYSFWCWVVGFYMAFMPLYALGLMGMTRRLQHYPSGLGWHIYLVVAAVGALIIFLGIIFQIVQLLVSIKYRHQYRVGNDPWDGRTLEWSIPSPAPFYNFAFTPEVQGRDPYWEQKQQGQAPLPSKGPYQDIHMPKNTGKAFVTAMLAGVFCFGIIWNMALLTAVSGIGVLISILVRTFDFNRDYYVPAKEVEETEKKLWSEAKS
jgi:cytochrome o ubiquinol oxidase subunit 1